jgi:hypothetical protein
LIQGGKMKKISLLALLTILVITLSLAGVSCNNSYSYGTEEALGWGIGIFAVVCWIFFALIGIFFFVVWIITIVDCAKRKNEEFPDGGENAKTIWLVVLLVTWLVGFWWVAAIVYYFMVMRKKPLKR